MHRSQAETAGHHVSPGLLNSPVFVTCDSLAVEVCLLAVRIGTKHRSVLHIARQPHKPAPAPPSAIRLDQLI